MIIAISGDSYSGKSTTCRHLKEKLSCEYFSAGDIYRELAAKENKSIEQFMEENCHNEDLTNTVNDTMLKKMREAIEKDAHLVIEGRMIAQIVNSNDIDAVGINLFADLVTRVRRCSKRNGTNEKESLDMIFDREISERKMGADIRIRVKPISLDIDTTNLDEETVNKYAGQFVLSTIPLYNHRRICKYEQNASSHTDSQ